MNKLDTTKENIRQIVLDVEGVIGEQFTTGEVVHALLVVLYSGAHSLKDLDSMDSVVRACLPSVKEAVRKSLVQMEKHNDTGLN
jgi:hypothetical protein